MKESQIQRTILAYLSARHILAFRMNTGAMSSEYKGKVRYMRFGAPGMADILAFPQLPEMDITRTFYGNKYYSPGVLWVEVKAETGKQSELQKSFQEQVEREGHKYIVARGIDDVAEALK